MKEIKKPKFSNHWVCDFETITQDTNYYKEHKQTGLTYGYIEHMESGYNYQFNKISQLIDFITMYRFVPQFIYFHNLSFDGVFILDWLGKNGYTLTDEEVVKPKEFAVFRSTGNKIYRIIVGYRNSDKKHSSITFLCSKLLLATSVEQLGKAVNIDKYEFAQKEDKTFHIREPEDDVDIFYEKNMIYCDYCKRDVKIVKAALKEFFDAIYEFLKEYGLEEHFKKCTKQPTISSLSFTLQKLVSGILHNMSEGDLYINNFNTRSIMDKFTNGGLTIWNRKYLQQELEGVKGFIIDLKSAYPAIMSDKLPYGEMLNEPPSDSEYCCFVEVHYEHIQADNHTIPLLKRWGKVGVNENLYELSFDNYTTYLLEEEMNQIEKLFIFKNKTIINRYYFRLKNYLSEFVEKMFYYKEFYKKDNPAKSHTFKILLNSGYGIHAKRYDFKSVGKEIQGKDIYEQGKKLFKRNEFVNLNRIDRHSYIPNNNLVALDPIHYENWSSFNHKAIANFITAKTRIKLMKGMEYFGSDHFLYCDTDSLFLINVEKEKIDAYCGKKLGDWELEEKTFDKCIVLRSKLYQLSKDNKIVKVGTAGIKKGYVDFGLLMKERHLLIKDANIIPLRVDGGLILVSVAKLLNITKINDHNSKFIDFGDWNKDFETYLKKEGLI